MVTTAFRTVRHAFALQVGAALDRMGIDHPWNRGDLIYRIRRVIARSSPDLHLRVLSPRKQRVLFFSVRGMSMHIPYFVGVAAHALSLRGVQPEIVVCDGVLPACESVAITDYPDLDGFLHGVSPLATCDRCYGPVNRVLQAFSVPFRRLGDYVSYQEVMEAAKELSNLSLAEMLSYSSQGLHLGEHVRTSLYRFFLVGSLDDNPGMRAVAQRYLATGLVLARVIRELFEKIDPLCVISHHGIYLLGGVVCEVAKSMGVRVVAWDSTYRANTVIMSHGETYHHELRYEPTDHWEHLDLTPARLQRLEDYLKKRRVGDVTQDYGTYHPNPISAKGEVRNLLGLDHSRPIIALFTNVTWDGRVHVPDGIFAGPLDWVLGTLARLSQRRELQVVVRIHPAEVKHGIWIAQQRMDKEIQAAFPSLPDHIRVIPPESDINSYTLAELADVALVYSTKMGLEVALMGKPIVVAGDAFYGRKRLMVEPETMAEYMDIMDALPAIKTPEPADMLRLRRYAYHYYFGRAIPIPDVAPLPRGSESGYLRSLADLLPGHDRAIDVISTGIIDGAPFVFPM